MSGRSAQEERAEDGSHQDPLILSSRSSIYVLYLVGRTGFEPVTSFVSAGNAICRSCFRIFALN
jgi:hypothetical protein